MAVLSVTAVVDVSTVSAAVAFEEFFDGSAVIVEDFDLSAVVDKV